MALPAFDVSYTTWVIIVHIACNRRLFCIISRGPFPSPSPLGLSSAHYLQRGTVERPRCERKKETERSRPSCLWQDWDTVSVCGSSVNLTDTGKQGKKHQKNKTVGDPVKFRLMTMCGKRHPGGFSAHSIYSDDVHSWDEETLSYRDCWTLYWWKLNFLVLD